MKHKYDMEQLLRSIADPKGSKRDAPELPPAPRSYTGDEIEIASEAYPRQELVSGTRLYKQDAMGRWYFMPVFIRHDSLPGSDHLLELENAVLRIDGAKQIVRTSLPGRRGTVKELVSIEDYKITITALVRSSDGSYPAAQIARLKALFDLNESVELISVITDLVLAAGDRVVLTSIKYPSTPGLEDGQAVTIECETDSPFELILE